MSLTEKLTTLDEIIWKLFEKVTVKANKELGWNKYDLARLTDTVASMSYAGMSFYFVPIGYLSDTPEFMALGAVCTATSPFMYRRSIKENNKKEKEEIAFLERNGAPQQPKFKPYRPLGLGFASYFFISSAERFYNGVSTEFAEKIQNVSQYENLSTLILGFCGIFYTFNTISSYFKDQIVTPPSKKKGFWKTLYNKAKEPFRPKLEPIPIPVDNEYQTIENLLE